MRGPHQLAPVHRGPLLPCPPPGHREWADDTEGGDGRGHQGARGVQEWVLFFYLLQL